MLDVLTCEGTSPTPDFTADDSHAAELVHFRYTSRWAGY